MSSQGYTAGTSPVQYGRYKPSTAGTSPVRPVQAQYGRYKPSTAGTSPERLPFTPAAGTLVRQAIGMRLDGEGGEGGLPWPCSCVARAAAGTCRAVGFVFACGQGGVRGVQWRPCDHVRGTRSRYLLRAGSVLSVAGGQVLTMAAAMGFRSPFFCPIDKREEADKARKTFATGHSDLLTTLKAFDGWQARPARPARPARHPPRPFTSPPQSMAAVHRPLPPLPPPTRARILVVLCRRLLLGRSGHLRSVVH
jgi:hypothetical protein